MHDCRMIIWWPKACRGLLGVAADGAKPGLRLSPSVPKVRDALVIAQAIQVSDAAAKSLDAYEWAL